MATEVEVVGGWVGCGGGEWRREEEGEGGG